MPEQTHPQYSTDRDRIDMLLGHQGDPDENHLTTAAMLLNRYEGVQGADDLLEDLHKSLRAWGMTRDELNTNVDKSGQLVGFLVKNYLLTLDLLLIIRIFNPEFYLLSFLLRSTYSFIIQLLIIM